MYTNLDLAEFQIFQWQSKFADLDPRNQTNHFVNQDKLIISIIPKMKRKRKHIKNNN